MKTKIKTIDVIAKEWFDKVNGNSYFSMVIIINYQMKSEKSFSVPMQYGYEDHYRDMAFEELVKRGYLQAPQKHTSYWRYYKENDIIARHIKHENCRKREL